MKGLVKVTGIDAVKNALLREGFKDPTPLQVWKKGQVFGLVKEVGDTLEMHVRGYNDSTLESEIELSREYLEHPYDCKPYYGPLLDILKCYRIPFSVSGKLPSDPAFLKVPKKRTPWKPIAIGVGILLLSSAFLLWAASEGGKEN
jgi:hypothetical protein